MEILFVNNKKNKIWNKILFCFFKLNHLKTILLQYFLMPEKIINFIYKKKKKKKIN